MSQVPRQNHQSRRPHEQPWMARTDRLNPQGPLAPYINEFLQGYLHTDRLQTAYAYKRELSMFATDFPLSEPHTLTRPDLMRYVAKRGAGMAPSTVATTISVLRRWFAWMHDMNVIQVNHAMALKRPPARQPEPRFLTPDDITRLLHETRNDWPVKVFIALAAYAGLRKGSIHSLQWEDVDLAECRIVVRFAKGGRHIIVPMADSLHSILSVWRGMTTGNDSGYVLAHEWDGFAATKGCWRPYYYTTLSSKLKRYIKQAGLPEWVGPHDLRRTFATILHQQHVDITVISRLLGHRNVATTMTHYAFTDDQQKEDAIASLPY